MRPDEPPLAQRGERGLVERRARPKTVRVGWPDRSMVVSIMTMPGIARPRRKDRRRGRERKGRRSPPRCRHRAAGRRASVRSVRARRNTAATSTVDSTALKRGRPAGGGGSTSISAGENRHVFVAAISASVYGRVVRSTSLPADRRLRSRHPPRASLLRLRQPSSAEAAARAVGYFAG